MRRGMMPAQRGTGMAAGPGWFWNHALWIIGLSFLLSALLATLMDMDPHLSGYFYDPTAAQRWFLKTAEPWIWLYRYGELPALILAIAAIAGWSQSPAPDPDTLKNPVKQIDPEVKQMPSDLYDANEYTRINADELPAAVLDKLKELEPSGWEKSVVYLERKKKIYHIEIREEESEKKHYRFDAAGKQLKDEGQGDKKDN